MSVRPVLVGPPPPDAGISLKDAATIIGADTTTVRELVHLKQLKGWKVGKLRRRPDGTRTPPTGVRVSEESCYAYRERNSIGDATAIEETAPARRDGRRQASTAVADECFASLRAKGFRV